MAEQQSGVEGVGSGHGEQVVTPWEAHAGEGQQGIDYDKLIRQYQEICLTIQTQPTPG